VVRKPIRWREKIISEFGFSPIPVKIDASAQQTDSMLKKKEEECKSAIK
jgi:hypothetical protein